MLKSFVLGSQRICNCVLNQIIEQYHNTAVFKVKAAMYRQTFGRKPAIDRQRFTAQSELIHRDTSMHLPIVLVPASF